MQMRIASCQELSERKHQHRRAWGAPSLHAPRRVTGLVLNWVAQVSAQPPASATRAGQVSSADSGGRRAPARLGLSAGRCDRQPPPLRQRDDEMGMGQGWFTAGFYWYRWLLILSRDGWILLPSFRSSCRSLRQWCASDSEDRRGTTARPDYSPIRVRRRAGGRAGGWAGQCVQNCRARPDASPAPQTPGPVPA
jgi:hypothetical protein